ncbi:MAG TPA: TIGR03435 family protein [Bryobacteraceae bacterium]|jgi:uncharacterized protein (TIGR03435 family)|nr:TIGR03435 family protein [Bryobacteraceae bacterium]
MKKLLLYLALAPALGAQTPAFEVASIKPSQSAGGGSSIRVSAGRIAMENDSLKKITLWAYGIPDDREYALIGPDSLSTERFDIQATFPADTPPASVRLMTQALLTERFKLTLHRETRQLPIYVLVVGKNGPKIHSVEDGQGRTSGRPGRLEATKIPIQKLADLLARLTGQQVVDETGLKGVFDFTLEWSPDETQKMTPDEVVAAAATGPSIYSALQEQLGLKLQGRKGPVEVLVVDHIEKAPTGN